MIDPQKAFKFNKRIGLKFIDLTNDKGGGMQFEIEDPDEEGPEYAEEDLTDAQYGKNLVSNEKPDTETPIYD